MSGASGGAGEDGAGLGRSVHAVLGHPLLGKDVAAVHDHRDQGDRQQDRPDHHDDGLAGLVAATAAPMQERHGNTLSIGIS